MNSDFVSPRSGYRNEGVAQLVEAGLRVRSASADEIAEARASWWRLSRGGLRLPAENGLIVINGGQRR